MARSQRTDPLESGMTMSGGSADPISGQFSKIRSLIGAASPSSLATPVPGGPTTGFAAGPTSTDIYRQGENLVGGTGVNLSAIGNNLLGSGVNMLGAPADFFSALLSGDPTRMTQALAPTAATISQQNLAPLQTAQQNLPRGGYAASTAAELPFSEASQVGNAALNLQPAAAQALSKLGIDVSQLGLGEQGMGLEALQNLVQNALGKMGVTKGITENLANVGSFLQSII